MVLIGHIKWKCGTMVEQAIQLEGLLQHQCADTAHEEEQLHLQNMINSSQFIQA